MTIAPSAEVELVIVSTVACNYFIVPSNELEKSEMEEEEDGNDDDTSESIIS